MPSTAGGSGSGTYDAITAFGVAMPGWVQALMLAYTSYGLVLVVPLFAWLWWRARPGGPERMAAALLVPIGTVLAYGLSELVKAFVHEQRPCRGLPVTAIVGKCPPPGDWSFPSNHSTIAAAAALGAAFAWRRGAPWLAVFAALMGFSRVFVGAHYPHDVLIGLALGAGIACLLQLYALSPATTIVRSLAGRVPFGLLGAPAPRGEQPTVLLAQRRPGEPHPRRIAATSTARPSPAPHSRSTPAARISGTGTSSPPPSSPPLPGPPGPAPARPSGTPATRPANSASTRPAAVRRAAPQPARSAPRPPTRQALPRQAPPSH
ncbi:phosphatase PAP2 family protein [Amycolatopsis jejuensis]|uniref:phosphatase PAP2 family protein n=1 Tax=Amycolatopsis jejuensis TaxID=330084 RepID=UPI000A0622CF|nr:phosphatase PAP2 family protein [Amycolatopsis jejuensis]